MKHRIKILLLAAIFTGTSLFAGLLQAPSTSALSGGQFKAGRIIDDSLFYNGETMTAPQIQQFLDAKIPTCDTNGSKIFSGTTTRAEYGASRGYPAPYTCLKSFKQDTPYRAGESGLCSAISAKTGRSAAQIIDDIARACHISQKVLIVMLQKEQALVTDDWPWSIQYRSAMGYGCPDGGAVCDSEYYGFFNQVYNAARQFQRYKADPNNWNHVPNMNNSILYQADMPSCGSETVYIENFATAGLYNYTPYTPNKAALDDLYGGGDDCSAYGNRNFWRYYNDWFGSTSGTPFFHISGSNKVYMMGSNNNYYYIPTADILKAYGWKSSVNTIASYSSEYIAGRDYSGVLPLIARFESSEIYLIDLGLRRHFPSQEILTNYGYTVGEEALLPDIYLQHYKKVSPVRSIARDVERGHIYMIENKQRRHFTGPSAYKSGDPAYSSLPRVDLSSEYIDSMSYGAPIYRPGTLVRVGTTSPIHIINDVGKKIYIPNSNVMTSFGFSPKTVASVNQLQADAYPSDTINLKVFIKNAAGSIFLADSGVVRSLSSEIAGPTRYNIDPATINTVVDGIIAPKLNGEALTELIRATGDTKVYLVKDGVKRHVKSPAELKSLGYTFDDVTDVSSYLVSIIPN